MEHAKTQPQSNELSILQAHITKVYKCQRTDYLVQSVFNDKTTLSEAFFRIALSGIKSS